MSFMNFQFERFSNLARFLRSGHISYLFPNPYPQPQPYPDPHPHLYLNPPPRHPHLYLNPTLTPTLTNAPL